MGANSSKTSHHSHSHKHGKCCSGHHKHHITPHSASSSSTNDTASECCEQTKVIEVVEASQAAVEITDASTGSDGLVSVCEVQSNTEMLFSSSGVSEALTEVDFVIQAQSKRLWEVSDVSDSLLHISDLERTNSSIISLKLSGNSYSETSICALVDALKNQKKIKTSDLSDIFTGRMKETIKPALLKFAELFDSNGSLVELDLSDNAFGPIGAESVALILEKCPSIVTIKINNNGLGPEGGKKIAAAFELIASENSSLKVLSVGRNRLEHSAATLVTALAKHPNLEELSMYQDGIRREHMPAFLTALRGCSNLISLDIQDNTLTKSGAEILAETLPHLPKLRHLNVGDCLLKSSGCIILIDAILSSEIPIETLNLQYNEIEEEAALHIAKCLPRLGSLKKLILNGNEFDPEGTAANLISKTLAEMGKSEIIDEWDDMEYDGSEYEDETDDEQDNISPSKTIEEVLEGEIQKMSISTLSTQAS